MHTIIENKRSKGQRTSSLIFTKEYFIVQTKTKKTSFGIHGNKCNEIWNPVKRNYITVYLLKDIKGKWVKEPYKIWGDKKTLDKIKEWFDTNMVKLDVAEKTKQ